MTEAFLKLAIIIGSTRDGRLGDRVGAWFTFEASKHGNYELDVIDIAEIDLPSRHTAVPTPAVAQFASRIAAADAFVIVTPEYNHSYPGHLKHAIDQAGSEWHAKPVGFVSYGGTSGGLRAVEHLRQVFAELHAVTVRECVSFHGVWKSFDDAGQPSDRVGTADAAKLLLDQLAWWAKPLREARATVPYSSAA